MFWRIKDQKIKELREEIADMERRHIGERFSADRDYQLKIMQIQSELEVQKCISKDAQNNSDAQWRKLEMWRAEMMETVGEDGVDSVVKKIKKLQADLQEANFRIYHQDKHLAALRSKKTEDKKACPLAVAVGQKEYANPATYTLAAAIDTYGQRNQMMMAVEEAAELIQAINKYFRCDGKNEAVTNDLRGEIADMSIMLAQLEIMFGGAELDMVKDIKLERLAKRIKEANGGK